MSSTPFLVVGTWLDHVEKHALRFAESLSEDPWIKFAPTNLALARVLGSALRRPPSRPAQLLVNLSLLPLESQFTLVGAVDHMDEDVTVIFYTTAEVNDRLWSRCAKISVGVLTAEALTTLKINSGYGAEDAQVAAWESGGNPDHAPHTYSPALAEWVAACTDPEVIPSRMAHRLSFTDVVDLLELLEGVGRLGTPIEPLLLYSIYLKEKFLPLVALGPERSLPSMETVTMAALTHIQAREIRGYGAY